MALDFDSTDVVTVSPASSINSLAACTWILWTMVDTATVERGWISKGTGSARRQFGFSNNSEFRAEARTTTALHQAYALNSNMPTFATGKWNCVVAQYDLAVDNAVRLFCGDLTTLVAEASAYSFGPLGTAGTTSNDSAANLKIGQDEGTSALDCKIARVLVFNRYLSLAEIQSVQFWPRNIGGLVLWHELGYFGTGTQPDYSGNGNNGSVTGATTFEHVPITFRRVRPLHVPYRAVSAAAPVPPMGWVGQWPTVVRTGRR